VIEAQADLYLTYKNCIFEKGDPALGSGNYVIRIEEEGKTVFAIIMMDSHNLVPYTKPDGSEIRIWAYLTEQQLAWYSEQIAAVERVESCMIMHMPIYEYNVAFDSAWNSEYEPKSVDPHDSYDEKYWNEGYKGSFGVKYEGICSYPEDEGVFDVILKEDSTKTIIVGHDHRNNFCIKHKGVKFVYGMKIGEGCCWNEKINGGTVMRISDSGSEIEHVFVDPTPFMKCEK